MDDYVVAIHVATNKVHSAWKGNKFKKLDYKEYHQIKISLASSKAKAMERAMNVYTQLKKMREEI